MRVTALAVVAVLALCACTGGEPQRPPASPSPSASTGTSAAPPSPSPQPRLRALALTLPASGPPGALIGVDHARVVVEYPLGADDSGLLLLVDGPAEVVGPLRSATPSDATLAAGFAADLITARTSGAVVETLTDAGLAVVEEHGVPGGLLRDPARRAPYNLYAAPEVLRDALPARATEPPWEPHGGSATARSDARGTAAPGSAATGTAAPSGVTPSPGPRTEVTVHTVDGGTVTWTWDAAAQHWLRTADGQLQQSVTGERIAAAAVLVLEATAPDGRPPVVSDLRGTGAATVLHAGQVTAGRWQQDGDGPLPAVDGAGTIEGAGAGLTAPLWIHVCAAPCVAPPAPAASLAPAVPAAPASP